MEKEKILDELLHLLEKLDIIVKYDRGNFQGGLIKYHEEDYFYLNRKAEIDEKITTIVNELKNLEIPDEFINDQIREILVLENK